MVNASQKLFKSSRDENRSVKIVQPKKRLARRRCNICDKSFQPHSRFERYCEHCREESQLLHYYEWLPSVS